MAFCFRLFLYWFSGGLSGPSNVILGLGPSKVHPGVMLVYLAAVLSHLEVILGCLAFYVSYLD